MSTPRRFLLVFLGLISASLAAISVEGGHWWAIDNVSIGPISSAHCFGGDCQTTSLTWVDGSLNWLRLGTATFAAGLITTVVLVILAASLAAKRAGRLAAGMSLIALLTATLAGVGFILRFPRGADMPGAAAVMSRGILFFAISMVAGLAVSISVLRQTRPTD